MSTSPTSPQRRNLLGGAMLSLGGLLALANVATPASAQGRRVSHAAQDAELLNAAIALEHEGIAAYQIAAESGLLAPPVLQVGIRFQGHHKQHRDELIAAVHRLGGTPVAAQGNAEYATAIGAASLHNQADVLQLALRLERGATNAYLGLVPPLTNADMELLVARLAADEAYHVAVLANALQQEIPVAALMFG